MTDEQRAKRLHYHMYESLEGIQEHAERIVELEEAAQRMHEHIKQTCDICDEYYCGNWDDDNSCCVFDTMLRELGVEVQDG